MYVRCIFGLAIPERTVDETTPCCGFITANSCDICLSVALTDVQDGIVHAELRILLQSSQRLRVLVAQVPVQSKSGTEACAVVQRSEGEHVAPALVTPTVVD